MTALKRQKNNYGFEWKSAVPFPQSFVDAPNPKVSSESRGKKKALQGHKPIEKHDIHT